MVEYSELQLFTRIGSEYQVFDLSGVLPFGIVFGFCRQSLEDTDTRSITLDVSGTALDIPYGLANGLLTLSQGRGRNIKGVDLNSFRAEACPPRYITIPAATRQGAKAMPDDLVNFRIEVDNESDFARLLSPGTEYRINLASRDLGIKRWYYSSRDSLSHEGTPLDCDIESAKVVVSKKLAGTAIFTAEECLDVPPIINICLNMRLHEVDSNDLSESSYVSFATTSASTSSISAEVNSESTTDHSGSDNPRFSLEVCIANTTDRPVTIQSSGFQRYLSSCRAFQYFPSYDDRVRITSSASETSSKPHSQKSVSGSLKNFTVHCTSSASITQNLNEAYKRPICGLRTGPRRFGRSAFTTLRSGESVIRRFDLYDWLVTKLKLGDGLYVNRLEETGAWWEWGDLDEVFGKGHDMLDTNIWKKWKPGIVLRSDDEVVVRISNGRLIADILG